MKTNELKELALDWAVAKCDGVELFPPRMYGGANVPTNNSVDFYEPSSNWSQGGPIIEREDFHRIVRNLGQGYTVSKKLVVLTDDGEVIRWVHGVGPTILIAAMRCYVASKSGDDIEIPTELGETK